MSNYILRLDDASEKRNIDNWSRVEKILDKYEVKPLVGVVPDCQDPKMEAYQAETMDEFWNRVHTWIDKGWVVALHGYQHVYVTSEGGINPVNKKSEFAGVSLDEQKEKIRNGVEIFREHGVNPEVFFAPSHTFDENTIEALKSESDIRIISDTVANKAYYRFGMTFVPQQCGAPRRLPFSVSTFCLHPNTMKEKDFEFLEKFLEKNGDKFVGFPCGNVERKRSLLDIALNELYFIMRMIRR